MSEVARGDADFEAYQETQNKADIAAKFGGAEKAEPVKEAAKAAPEKKETPKEEAGEKKKGVGSLTYRELREAVRSLTAELETLKAQGAPKEEIAEAEEELAEAEAKGKDAKPAVRTRPKADDKTEKGEAKYKTWEEYEDDLLAWNEERIFSKIDEKSSKQRQEAQIEAMNNTIKQSWNERVEKSREAHDDFDEALASDTIKLIGPGSLVDKWILESEYGAELLYHFVKNPQDLKQFENVKGAADAYRRLAKLEEKFNEESKEKPEPKAEEKGPRMTKTPKPVSEVGGRGTTLPDPISAAVADGSDEAVGRYIAEQNRREIRQRFGDRK